MIEIRNDEIGREAGQRSWADRLANILGAAELHVLRVSYARELEPEAKGSVKWLRSDMKAGFPQA
jgi:hypothetical protein